MRKTRCFYLIFLFFCSFFAFSACASPQNADTISFDSVYHKELGTVLTLGMTKDQIDNLTGEAPKKGDTDVYYEYSGRLSVDYKDGKATLFFIDSNLSDWTVRGGISSGTAVDRIYPVWGDQEITARSREESLAFLGDSLDGLSSNVADLFVRGAMAPVLDYYITSKGPADFLDHTASITFYLSDDHASVDHIRLSARSF